MATATPEVNLSDAELLGLATTYIALRSELMERGDALAKEIVKRTGKT